MNNDNICPKCNRVYFDSDARSGDKVRICPWFSCQYYERKPHPVNKTAKTEKDEKLDKVLNEARLKATKSANPRRIFGDLYKGIRNGKVLLENKQYEKCPGCGADQRYRNPTEYKCRSWVSRKMEFKQSEQCATNEIEQEKKCFYENIENSISSYIRSTNKSVSEYGSTEELLRDFIAYLKKIRSIDRIYVDIEHDYRTCEIPDCIECQDLIDYDIICACDECDMPGDKNIDSWFLKPDGRVLCTFCNEKEDEFTEHMAECETCCEWTALCMVSPLRGYPTEEDELHNKNQNILARRKFWEQNKEKLISHGISYKEEKI